jgi:predicted HNH restriction endonuclease
MRCPRYAEEGKSRCLECHRLWEKQRKAEGATGRRGTSSEWSKARLESLRRHHWRCGCGVHISELKAKGQVMAVHHVNGDARDHDQANLRPVCPACHKALHQAARSKAKGWKK